ncbi:LysM peptidoglycan-binding domain-containing protein [Flavobacterium sp. GT3R68]|uniref:LysM peptidoglycan-binding domain-containing protein n=1 Tax=Flavobacterium sp. GT3R68 TaxID=2594437 RepID=UPI000F88383B|nr:LysM peptidoglycan-binding domain-containing protein [Flavobacterium sp. GT3R68]RTY95866.1 LysM peptidoglycan-binding domain-containing protein [Flavobacterium sp. GSN2]TRW93638.1 LysM peptidoglycan-binding domain-containing protein [Flavobacterium sp. GT3R68]
MKLRNFTLILLLSLSLNTFAQYNTRNLKTETKNTYLDSIKATFVHDNIASCVDSLWMKELTNLDLYNDLSVDIKNINVDQKVDYELSTELLKKRLALMDAKSPFNIEYNQGLENVIKSFLKNRKKSFERLMAISEYYFPIFEEAMARQNVPLEIKYLAVVESALNPKAVSRVGATGLWQFMFQTGKQYNLDISTYVDERSDPVKASDAAATYMSNMYKIFGDWDLVLASYNSGPGNIAKAIRRSGGHQNYWNIRKNLPKETQGYVPAFLATMYIYEYHKEHGIVPNRAIIKHFATDTIMIKQQISFKQISELLCIPVSQLQLLNPSYKRDVIPYIAGQQNFLRLPNDKIAIYTSNEDKIYAYVQYEESLREKTFTRGYERAIASRDSINTNPDSTTVSGIKYYKVKRGDNLSDIAGKYGVAMSDIKKWNKLKSNKVPLGKNLKIHTSETKTAEQTANRSDLASAETKENQTESTFKDVKVVSFVKTTKTYKVKKGDNLGEIAEKHDVSVADIKKWNKLKNNNVALGKSLKIMTSERVVSKVRKEIKAPKIAVETKAESIAATEVKDVKEEKSEFYIVQKGDNLGTIAKKQNVTVAEIKEWNNLPDANIQMESRLKVSNAALENGNPVAQGEPEFKTQEYIVVKGDNLGNIAKKYNVAVTDLKEWNNLEDQNIQLGSKLIVSKKEIIASKASGKKDKLAEASKSKQALYSVRKGDSLFSIAKKYPGVTISDIKKWNGISNENLKPGMKLKING